MAGTTQVRQMLVPALALVALAAAEPLRGQVAWQVDLGAAREEAASAGKPLFVLVLQDGEADSRATWAATSERAAAKALAGVVPVLVCVGTGADTAARAAELELTEAKLRACSESALRDLFDARATITTPQHIAIAVGQGVLSHRLNTATAAELAKAAHSAQALVARGQRACERQVRAHVRGLTRRADRDPLAREALGVALRLAGDERFVALARDAVRARVGAGLVESAVQALPRSAMTERAQWLVASRDRVLTEVGRRTLERAQTAPPDLAATASPAVAPLRPAEDLGEVLFADGAVRQLAGLRGKVVVLWLFLPDDPTLPRQVAALAPVLAKLQAAGAECYALAAGLDRDAALAQAASAAFGCAVGAYRFDALQPWQGVASFPSALVIEPAGQVVYADGGDGDRQYLAFAPVAAALLRHGAGSSPSPR